MVIKAMLTNSFAVQIDKNSIIYRTFFIEQSNIKKNSETSLPSFV